MKDLEGFKSEDRGKIERDAKKLLFRFHQQASCAGEREGEGYAIALERCFETNEDYHPEAIVVVSSFLIHIGLKLKEESPLLYDEFKEPKAGWKSILHKLTELELIEVIKSSFFGHPGPATIRCLFSNGEEAKAEAKGPLPLQSCSQAVAAPCGALLSQANYKDKVPGGAPPPCKKPFLAQPQPQPQYQLNNRAQAQQQLPLPQSPSRAPQTLFAVAAVAAVAAVTTTVTLAALGII